MRAFLFLMCLGCTDNPSAKTAPGSVAVDSGVPSDTAVETVLRCNTHAELCDRPLNQVAFAATHNAMSSEEAGWLAPNQRYAVPTQLNDGVRALNFDVYDVEGVATLCHAYCELGSQLLVDGLAQIGTFLTEHPREVVLLTFENYASASLTVAAFDESGLKDLAYAQTPGEPWPTLGQLIDRDQRLVVFTSDGGGEPAWYHALWDWWRDNPYSAQSEVDFSCDHYRGEPTNDLYALNHFLTAPIAQASLAEEANTAESIGTHLAWCEQATGRFPNMVMVDFYSIGSVLEVVDAINLRD
jgi:hypothetical protein